MTALFTTSITSLPLLNKGKVRENYAVGDDKILMVASDRISAYDVIMEQPIPGKGTLLTQMSLFWFAKLQHICPNHLTTIAPETVVSPAEKEQVKDRAVVVKRLKPILIEAVVRGYLAGSGWQEYQQQQTVCGIALPAGLTNAAKLEQPIFTPAAKAEVGEHDENIDFATMEQRVGTDLAQQIRRVSLALYQSAADYALSKGIIIADTKFEFGLDGNGNLVLMDEVLTPDSSRYWPADQYQQALAAGKNPPSFDKQFLRDWLTAYRDENGNPWPKTKPAPTLAPEIIAQTAAKYQQAFELLTK